MRFTRRLPGLCLASLVASVAGLGAMLGSASCSSDGEGFVADDAAAPMTDADADLEPVGDAGADVTADADAGPTGPVVAPRAVECTSPPCAKSLVRTLTEDDRGEGYCVLLDDKTVACWGSNSTGQLGRGDGGVISSARAERVPGLTSVESLYQTCAVDSSGDVWCWGQGPFLQSTSSSITNEPSPVKLPIPKARRVSYTKASGCGIFDDGVRCWGGRAPYTPTPAELPAGAAAPRDIATSNASFVILDDGSALSWGANPPIGRVSSLPNNPHPGLLFAASVQSVDTIFDNACAVVGNTGYCWGAPGDLSPDGDINVRALPQPVVTPEPIVQIATTRSHKDGSVVELWRWCAVGVSGAVHCWGNNANGQAGDGTLDFAAEPVEVKGLPAPAVEVKIMPHSSCALLVTGKVFCWGSNYYGQIGNGRSKGEARVPEEVALP
mgnify:CR=1 FL=1